MQQRQQNPSRSSLRRRNVQRNDFNIGLLTSALTIGAVLILLAATFVGDWLRTPGLAISSTTQTLSPNGDQDHDTIGINYELSDDADISVRVVGEGSGVVHQLLAGQPQPAGRHFITWDGRNDVGAIVPDGRYRIEVTAHGPVRSTTQSVSMQVDTRPPVLQLVNMPDEARVGEEIIAIEGISDPDAVVWVSGEPQPLAVDSQGHFTFQRKLLEGSNLFEIRAVDQSGNTTRIQRELILVTTPPDVMITQPADGEWSNQAISSFRGQVPPGTSVAINNQTVSLDEGGNFEHELLLNEGENLVQITATDDVGNITTMERVVYLKTIPPEIHLNIGEGSQVSDSLLQITGQTEPGATILVNGRVIPVSSLGDFQTTLTLSEGFNTISVQARDQAGNVTDTTRQVTYSIPQPTDGLTRLLRNFEELPSLFMPALIVIGLIFAFLILRQNQVSLLLSVDQSSFSPGLPGENKVLELSLDLNKPARITLEVLDQYGHVLATILHNRRRSDRLHLFHWDGYDDYGHPVQPGEYTIQATAGTPPVKVTSAVQVKIEEDPYVHRQMDQRRITRRGSRLP